MERDKMLSNLENNIQFYKKQIIYCQSLLEDLIYQQTEILRGTVSKKVTLREKMRKLKEINKKEKKILKKMNDTICPNLENVNEYLIDTLYEKKNKKDKNKNKKDKDKNKNKKKSKKEDKFNADCEEDDNRRVRIKQFNARESLETNEDNINKIRLMEQKLIKGGKTPEEARIETQKKLYPESLLAVKEDGTVNRSHNLLGLRDSDSDSDNDEDSDNNDLPELKREKNIEEKVNELFENDIFDSIESGDNVDPNDIEKEVEIANFEK